MIEESGRVVGESGDSIWVSMVRQSTCQSCSAQKGCGQKLLAEMSSGRANQVKVLNTLGAKTGDQVVIGIDESILLRASLMVYLWPLVLMIVAAVLADHAFPDSEVVTVLAGSAGLALGFFVVNRYQTRHAGNPQYAPQLLRRENAVHSAQPISTARPVDKQIVS